MLSKRIANYTTKPTDEIEFSEETLYSHVGDRLVAVNGESLSYDNYGRLLNYKGKALTWQSNRLANVDGVAITYDAFGRRVQKGATTFTYDSNNLLTAGDLAFFYDTHGIAGFTYEGATYFYRKNIQGDVIALLTADGTVVATYLYDAWGNCIIATDTNCIGELNPIRYRSYYWDSEFGLYFLQSRYYSPSLCRFISQDSIEYLNPQAINGLNLYAYCGSNPVNRFDPSGHAFIITSLILFAIFGAFNGWIESVQTGEDPVACIVGGTVQSLISGIFFVIGAPATFPVLFFSGFLAGAVGDTVKEAIKEDGYIEGNENIIKNAVSAGLTNMAFGFIGAQVPGLEKGAKLMLEYLFNSLQLALDVLSNYLER